MLAITLLTNNTLQNLLEPVAFGKTLRLHPLVVMLVTTAGTLLFGLLGATLAAPVTAVALRTINLLRDTGLFGALTTPSPAAVDVPSPQGGREASADPGAAE
jgi:putative heme transporter